MRVIEKNEQIIGKTLVNHNKKLKQLEMGGVEAAPVIPTQTVGDSAELTNQVEEVNSLVKDLVKEISFNRQLIDKMKQDINEMKYILDTVNPMEYVKISQVNDLIDEKLKKKG